MAIDPSICLRSPLHDLFLEHFLPSNSSRLTFKFSSNRRFLIKSSSSVFCLLHIFTSHPVDYPISNQNGASEVETIFDTENPRFIRNGRDLATISFADQLYTEAFRAALILFTQGALGGSVGPYTDSERQMGFATFGEPHILTAMAAASSSTRHAWYQKVSPV